MNTTVTAILPTYNRVDFLAECLDAIIGQTRRVDEIIIWDDGSTDHTRLVARDYGASFECPETTPQPAPLDPANAPLIRYVHAPNAGKSRALNQALRRARGDYIWVCDDDDIALPWAVAMLAARLDDNPATVAAAGSYRRFRDHSNTGVRSEEGPGHWPDLSSGSVLRHLLEDMFIFQNATLVRRRLFQRIGPFREDLKRSVDYEMVLRMAAVGPIEVVDRPVFLQRQHDGDRGPAALRHKADDTVAVWKNSDRAIFDRLSKTIPLSRYEEMFDSPDPYLIHRAACLQHACVYARHDDWETALYDLNRAAQIKSNTRLTRTEIAICRRMMSGKFAITNPIPAHLQHRLKHLACITPLAAEITRAIARGMVWRIRYGLQASGPRSAISAARFAGAVRLAARGRPMRPPAHLWEVSALPYDTGLDEISGDDRSGPVRSVAGVS